MTSLKEKAPFTADDLLQTVKKLKRYRSLMWNKAQDDGRLDYAIQYYEVVKTLIHGIYFTWEKYEYERGWIDSIAEEGEDLMEYHLFQVGVLERVAGLLQAIKHENLFEMFSGGRETNEMLILIYSDLLSNMKNGTIKLEKSNIQM